MQDKTKIPVEGLSGQLWLRLLASKVNTSLEQH